MFADIKYQVQKNIRNLKRKYRILKIKWILLFVLPILVIVLAYQVSKQFLKLKMKELGAETKRNTKPETTESKAEQA